MSRTAALLAGLSVLTDADLEGQSSRLTLRRARHDLDVDALEPDAIRWPDADSDEDGVEVVWADATCWLPAAGLAGTRCTCPARRLCRHRVRSIGYLQRLVPAEAGADVAAGAGAAWTPAVAWTAADLQRQAGRRLWRLAVGARADGLEVTREGETAAVLPSLGVRVRFLPGSPLVAAVCSCGSAQLCAHRVLAALAWHPHVPEADTPDPALAQLQDRIWGRLGTLLAAGLDGLPAEVGEGLAALAQVAAADLPAPARDLSALAGILASYRAREAGPQGVRWLLALGRLGARLLALRAETRTVSPTRLRGQGRRALLEAAPLVLHGLGAEGFLGAGGSVLKSWYLVAETGGWAQARVGRGAPPGESPPPPAALWRAPLWREVSTAQAAHARVRVQGARLGPDGSLSAGTSVQAEVQPEPLRASALPAAAVADSVAALVARWQQQAPPLLRDGREVGLPVVLALDPATPFEGLPVFSEADQTLRLPVRLQAGGRVTLQVRYAPENERLLAVLERVHAWRAPPSHLLVRFWPSGEGLLAAPISAWLQGRAAEDGPLSLGVGETPLGRSSAPPRRAVVHAHSAAQAGDVFQERLGVVQDLLESLAVEGAAHGAWRVPALEQAATGLDRLDLAEGAARVRALAAALARAQVALAPEPGAVLAALVQVLAWVQGMEEAWTLYRAARLSLRPGLSAPAPAAP